MCLFNKAKQKSIPKVIYIRKDLDYKVPEVALYPRESSEYDAFSDCKLSPPTNGAPETLPPDTPRFSSAAGASPSLSSKHTSDCSSVRGASFSSTGVATPQRLMESCRTSSDSPRSPEICDRSEGLRSSS